MILSVTSQGFAKIHQFDPWTGSCFGAGRGQASVLVHTLSAQRTPLCDPDMLNSLILRKFLSFNNYRPTRKRVRERHPSGAGAVSRAGESGTRWNSATCPTL